MFIILRGGFTYPKSTINTETHIDVQEVVAIQVETFEDQEPFVCVHLSNGSMFVVDTSHHKNLENIIQRLKQKTE